MSVVARFFNLIIKFSNAIITIYVLISRGDTMNFFVISEPTFIASSWHKNIMDGVVKLQQKKRLDMVFVKQITELEHFSVCDDDAIFIIGSNSDWLNSIILTCAPLFGNRIIVLGNHSRISNGMKYSSVMADVSDNIALLCSYLKFYKKNRIALYGINPVSASDKLKKEVFNEFGGTDADFFYNRGSLFECFNSFKEKIDLYDGVVCVNDYAAISLVKHLKSSGDEKRLFITSCGPSHLARLFSPSITHTQTDYTKFAGSAYELCKLLQKDKNINCVTIQVSSDFVLGQTTDFLKVPDAILSHRNAIRQDEDIYYTDVEITEMMKVESLLISCDNDDLIILERMLCDNPISQIADELYLSQSTVKYKIKKMYGICGVSTKQEFIRLMGKYLKNTLEI